MRAGLLRDLVTIQQIGAAVDAVGQPVETWSTFASVWADIRHPSGLETLKADVPTSVVRASIRIRELAGVTSGMRVLHGSTVYGIEAVLPVAPAAMDLVCERIG